MSESEYIFTLDQKTSDYCKENLKETPEKRNESLNQLKKWCNSNLNLHIDTSNTNLLAFLRACKFNLQKTQQKLKNYNELRRDIPEWFSNRNPHLPQLQELVKLGVFVPLRRTHNGQMVVIVRTAAHNPKLHTQNDVLKTGMMLLDIACLEDERAHIYGVTAIFDMKGVTLGHAKQLTPTIIKKLVNTWQNYHCRPKHLEFINAPVYVNVVLSIFKSFMSEKLKNRIRVHYKGPHGVYDLIDKDILPKEYGGCGESMDELVKYWGEKMLEYSDWFTENEQFKAD